MAPHSADYSQPDFPQDVALCSYLLWPSIFDVVVDLVVVVAFGVAYTRGKDSYRRCFLYVLKERFVIL